LQQRINRSSVVLGLCMLAAVGSTRFYRVNISSSVPRGVYRLAPVLPPVQRGTLVLVPTPAVMLPWHSRWLPLLKRVEGIAGDEICVQENRLVVRGDDFGPIFHEADGKALPRLEGCHIVQAGEVFLASRAARSLDGRYFGPVAVSALLWQAVPVVTW